MTCPPTDPKIYHITHVDNLLSIIADGVLWSDSERIRQGKMTTEIGMSTIKKRRLEELHVKCHPETFVGEYVPCYFCPRSVMLYLIYQGNHPELTYRGGQRPIVHLEASFQRVIAWASSQNQRWAFSLTNAGASYAPFHAEVAHLAALNWDAIVANDWRDPALKEGKQAEFLLYGSFPWHLVERIGVQCEQTWRSAVAALAQAPHRPTVEIMREWYY